MSFSLHRMSRRSICNLCLLLSGPPTNSEQTKSSPGEVSSPDEALDLRLSLLRLGDAKEAAKWNFAVPFNEELGSKAGKSLKWPGLVIPASPALRCSAENGLALTTAFTDAGGSHLKPTYWPNPPYSEEARKNKLERSRTYDVFFGAQGSPLLIIPHRHLKPEFDDIAVETIEAWKRSQPRGKGSQSLYVLPVR